MTLLNIREPLGWALLEAHRKLQELDPDPAGVTEEHAAWELLKALRGPGLAVKGLRLSRFGVEKIPLAIWHCYVEPKVLLDDINNDLIDPLNECADEANQECGHSYRAPTVARAEVRAWLDRSDGNTGSAKPAKHPGGRHPTFVWDRVWALIALDLHNGGIPQTDAEWIRRIQAACSRDGMEPPPSEGSLRPKVRLLRKVGLTTVV
jgi:hypothetical protein